MLSDFCLRMKMSGYPGRYRETIISSALKAWENMVEEDRTEKKPLYRDRSWRQGERAKEMERKKSGGLAWGKELRLPPLLPCFSWWPTCGVLA